MSERSTLTHPDRPSAPEGDSRSRSTRRVRLAGFLVGIVVAAGVTAVGVWFASAWGRGDSPGATSVPAAAKAPVAWRRPIVSAAGLAERSGVRIVQVAATGGGGLLDLRFQVLDPDKAAAVHDEVTPPAIVDEATGLVVNSLLMGHAHGGRYKAGLTYYLVFENPGNLVHRNGKVSVLLGDAQVLHVVVK